MAALDSETGEVLMRNLMTCNLDMETGESVGNESEIEIEPHQSAMKKTKFNVPRSYLIHTAQRKPRDKCCLDPKETYSLSSKEKVIELKEKIILGYNKTSHRLFLIPSLFIFPRVAAIIIIVSEIAMHVWSHRKNSRNENPKIYYRSPLHALTSQFCSHCLETKELHNDRYHKHKKRVVTSSFQ